jgi:hypothetical protein
MLPPYSGLKNKPRKKLSEVTGKLSETRISQSLKFTVVLLPLHYKQTVTATVPLPGA